jgi:uncharacterized membrane protein
MESLIGCLAAALLLVILAGPIVALVIALQARRRAAELAARVGELEAQVEVLRRHAGPERAAAAAPAPLPLVEPEPVPAPAAPPAVSEVPPTVSEAPSAASEGPPAAPPPLPLPDVDAAPDGEAGAAPAPGLEERLGARLPVWIGAVALALAGAYLVKYSIDRGWLSPAVRVTLGLLFGAALLGLGEWMRPRSARISQALSAAGIADLYAVLLAGVRLYDLIPPLVGFGLMATNTAVAVLLSLRQGPMIALLGLVGGFATPALVSTAEPNAGGLVAYLFLLDAGLVAVTRRRRWPLLGLGALAASLAWVAGWIVGLYRSGDALPLGLFLLASTALFAVTALRAAPAGGVAGGRFSKLLVAASVASGLLLLAVLVGVGGYGAAEWGMFALLAAGCYAIAAGREDLFVLAPFAAATTLALLAVRGWDLEKDASSGYLVTLGLLGAGLAGGAWAVAQRAARPARWAVLSASVLVLFPLLGYASTRDALDLPWAILALALSALAVAAAVPAARARQRRPEAETVLAAFAVAATLHASLALPLALERAWLSVAFAVEVPLLLELRRRLGVPALTTLARVAGALAAVRLLLNPEVLGYPVGARPLVNWLLWGYGVPLVAMLLAAHRSRSDGEDRDREVWETGAAAFSFALVTLEVWQAFAGGDLRRPMAGWGLLEWGTQAVAWFLLGGVWLEAGRRTGRRVFSWAARAMIALAAVQTLVVHAGIENPALVENRVGATPVVNLLLWCYGAPIVLLLVAAARMESEGGRRLPAAARVAALALTFLFATLEVRQLFRGSDLSGGTATNAEQFAYSATWILLGTGLLALGIARRERALRFAALAVMSVAVCKVFLWDTRELEDLYRVFSFLGLGVSLMLLAWLYQRFVFRREESA